MNPNEVSDLLMSIVPLNEPTFIWGGPGIGKSQLVAQVASTYGMELIDFRAVYRDPVDVRGYPSIDKVNKTVEWFLSKEFPTNENTRAIFFLDELTQAPQLVQAALLQLLLDRRIADYRVPPGVVFVAASNRMTDRAGGFRIISPVLDRFLTHLDMEPDPKSWDIWAEKFGVSHYIRSFMKFKRGSMLYTFDPSRNETSFATPRSWEKFDKVVKNIDRRKWFPILAGAMGKGIATEFDAFMDCYGQLPTMDEIVRNPMKARLPSHLSAKFAISGAMTHFVNTMNDEQAVRSVAVPIFTYGSRLEEDFMVMTFREIVVHNKYLLEYEPIRNWVSENRAVLLSIKGVLNDIEADKKNVQDSRKSTKRR